MRRSASGEEPGIAVHGIFKTEKTFRRLWLGAAIASVIATPALGGPPYVTDDPEPTVAGETESYTFTEGAFARSPHNETQSGFEINYGAMPDVQLNVELSVGHDSWHAATGIKYRFLEEKGDTPQASFYPAIEIGSGETHVLLPVWIAKSFGGWTAFGGGGYSLNNGRGQRNTWFGGAALTRTIHNDLSLGGEVYGETADTMGESGRIGVRAGLTQALGEHFALLASFGPEFESGEVRAAYYIAAGWHG